MTENLNYDLFRDPKWPRNWTSEAHILKVAHILYEKLDWCETSALFRKCPKTGILTYLSAQSAPKIEPLRPIFSTPPKMFAITMRSNNDVKPVKLIWKNDSKMAPKLGLWGPYSRKAILMWNMWKTYEKMSKDRNFGPFSGPKIRTSRSILDISPNTARMTI